MTRDIIVVGASSGGIPALKELVAGLPSDLPAAMFVVQHVANHSINYLPQMLAQDSKLPTSLAKEGKRFENSHIYVAPADQHLILDQHQMFLSRGPRENRVRPAIDPLFRSAAISLGPRVIGVILSGSLDDGTAGLNAIKQGGGLAVVQDPTDAIVDEMPQSAIDNVAVDHIVAVAEIAELLVPLVSTPIDAAARGEAATSALENARHEVDIVSDEAGDIDTAMRLGRMVPASCPDCGGPLWEMEGRFPRFRCHTGHAFTARHLVEGLKDAEEESLWVALRVMDERVRMLKRLAKDDKTKSRTLSEQLFADKAKEAEEHVERIKAILGRANQGGGAG